MFRESEWWLESVQTRVMRTSAVLSAIEPARKTADQIASSRVNRCGVGAVCAWSVEADATKFLVNADCGGRKPEYEVMKETYSLVAIGAVGGVTDGTTPAAKSKVATFPYLAPPP